MNSKPASRDEECLLPVHLDFTSIQGAAQSIEPQNLKEGSLSLSRLLSLSQTIEVFVLQEKLQFDLGATADWIPFREFFERSLFYTLVCDLGFPLKAVEKQVYADDEEILNEAEWAAAKAMVVSRGEARPQTEACAGSPASGQSHPPNAKRTLRFMKRYGNPHSPGPNPLALLLGSIAGRSIL